MSLVKDPEGRATGRADRSKAHRRAPDVERRRRLAPRPLGERLRKERDRLGLSLRELARRLEVSPSLVSQIETGKIQPSVRTLYAIVSELGVSLDELFAPAGSTPSWRDDRVARGPPGLGAVAGEAEALPPKAACSARATAGRSSWSPACAGSG